MSYQIIEPPFTLKFDEMSKGELEDYASWLRDVFDERMIQLEAAIRATPDFARWKCTFTPESLGQLGDWFAREVRAQSPTPEKLVDLKLRGELRVSVPSVDLTTRISSIEIDVGLYLARTLEVAYPELVWKQFFNDKRSIDYGQPVLVGFGRMPLNPIRLSVNLAYGLATGNQTGKGLMEIYEYWSNRVQSRKH